LAGDKATLRASGSDVRDGSPMERGFARTLEALGGVFDFISEFAARNSLHDSITFRLNLAVEELFVNMVKYNPGSRSDILIGMTRSDDRLVISLTDYDGEPFDITKAAEYDTDRPLTERPVGGLGIHLVRHIIDEISYEYKDRQSRIVLIKNLGTTDVQDRASGQ
jgi:serine/threonine-protein kinase RsbW